ncbi:hypothetical protein SK128_024687 [Halocaridina rubra]|uniref:TLDc domain-containing protein n=1 Tax=Halocaridina rubra TaxID=373956 RepID=A0AAN8XMN0_HALRR
MGNSASEFHHHSGSNSKLSGDGSPSQSSHHVKNGSAASSPQHSDNLVKLAKILVAKTHAEDNLDGISENVFLKYICKANQPLGKRLFQYYLHTNFETERHGKHKKDHASPDLLTKAGFLSAANYFIGLITDAEQLEFFIKVYSKEKDKIEKNDVLDLVQSAYEMAKSAHRMCCLPDNILMAVVKAIMHGKESVNAKYLHSWICQHCPRLVMWMHRYITHMLTVGHRTIPLNTDEKEDDTDTPILDCEHTSTCINLHPALIWLLTCTLPTLYTKPQSKNVPPSHSIMTDPHVFIEKMISATSPTHWLPLYNSDTDGMSMNRFQHHVFGYNGPTLIFITAEDENMFCIAADDSWKDSKHFWGREHSYCLQLTPEYKVVESGPKILYFNLTSRGFPTGFQVGQDFTNRALTIDLDLTTVTYRGAPYKIQALEVWGCGTVEARDAQIELKKHEIRDTEKRKKINLNAVDWVDNPDRYLLELASSKPNYAQYDKKTQGKSSNT